MTYKELVYIILDLSKAYTSDDAYYNPDHVKFLINRHRTQLLFEKYKDIKKDIPFNNYQTLTLNLKWQGINDEHDNCHIPAYVYSIEELPHVMTIGNVIINVPNNYEVINIILVPIERFKVVGYNKYLRNIIYCTIGTDNHLYLKSNNVQHRYLEKLEITALFEDVDKVNELLYPDEDLDCEFPLEEELIPGLIQMVVQELTGAAFKPEDTNNNAADDLSDLIAWARKNMKSDAQKQIEG